MFSNDAYGVTDTDPVLSDELAYGIDPFAVTEDDVNPEYRYVTEREYAAADALIALVAGA